MKKIFIVVLTFFAVISLASCKNNNSGKAASPWNEKTMTYKDSTGTLKITDIKQVTDFQGKPAITINFTLKNTSSSAYGVTQYTNALLAGYQDDEYLLAAIIDIDNGNMGDPVAAKATVKSSVSYSLVNEKDEVTLKFISSSSKKAVASYKIPLPIK
ncbi:DUF5067 domain-containing protein [Lactovum odontotermitis]